MVDKKEQSRIGKSNVRRSKTHERRVAALLTEWSGKEFRRRKVEGHDRSVIARESTADVIAVEHDFQFSVEAKCGVGFSLDALLATPKTCKATVWWGQACYDARLVSEVLGITIYPMIFCKPQLNTDWVGFSKKAFDIIKLRDSFEYIEYEGYSKIGVMDVKIAYGRKEKDIHMELDDIIYTRWKNFAKCVEPDNLFLKR